MKKKVQLDFTRGSADLSLLVHIAEFAALDAQPGGEPDWNEPVDVRAWRIACSFVRMRHVRGDPAASSVIERIADYLVGISSVPTLDQFRELMAYIDAREDYQASYWNWRERMHMRATIHGWVEGLRLARRAVEAKKATREELAQMVLDLELEDFVRDCARAGQRRAVHAEVSHLEILKVVDVWLRQLRRFKLARIEDETVEFTEEYCRLVLAEPQPPVEPTWMSAGVDPGFQSWPIVKD